jgi:hypothetical protein
MTSESESCLRVAYCRPFGLINGYVSLYEREQDGDRHFQEGELWGMLGEGHLLLLCSGSQMAFVLSHQTTPVPKSTVMKGGVTACLLIDCIAAITWAGSNRPKPGHRELREGEEDAGHQPASQGGNQRRDVEDATHRQASSLLRRSISRSVGSSKANEPLWIRPAGR